MRLLRQALEQQSEEEIVAGDVVAFDLDGTLAFYNGYKGPEHIGDPIPKAIALAKEYLEKGVRVVIFTARVGSENQAANDVSRSYVEEWTVQHVGQKLEVTAQKSPMFKLIYDDRARQVVENLGLVVTSD